MSNYDFYHVILKALVNNKVEFVLVGGMAVNAYGYMRSTGDMDLWVGNSNSNCERIGNALKFLNYSEDEIETAKIELLKSRSISLTNGNFIKVELISLLSTFYRFEDVFTNSIIKPIFDVEIPVIEINDLINIKVKSGRNKDLLDVIELKRIGGKH